MAYKKPIRFPTLTTERLTLRQLLESDVEEVFLLRSDRIVNKYLRRQPCITPDDAMNFITKINETIKISELKYWGITLKNDKKIIGTICLFNMSGDFEKCEIGYELLPDYYGQGIMSEAANKVIDYAFQTIGLKSIDAFTHQNNKRSTKLLQKLNFQKIALVDQVNPGLIVFRLTK